MKQEQPIFSVYENEIIEASLQTNTLFPDETIIALQAESFQQIDPETFSLQYRALSKSMVYQQSFYGMVVTDFSEGNVLKKSTPLLKDITIMADHRFVVGGYLGKVQESSWTKAINEVEIPGVNVVIEFDDDPGAPDDVRRALRGVRKSYLKGFSVNVWIEYRKSHPDLEGWDFYEKMGQEVDGEIVRFIVTEIKRYLEASVVVAGADPHAQPVQTLSQDAPLMASFSLTHGWQVPQKAQVALITNQEKEVQPMPRKRKVVLDATAIENEQVFEEIHEEETPPEELNIPESQEMETIKEDTNTVDVNVNSPQGFTQEQLDAAVEAAVEEKETELEGMRQEKEDLLKTQHRTELTTFYQDLKRDKKLAASFDELDVVEFMMSLSADGNPSQLDQFKAVLQEAAKFAQVPTTPAAPQAKEPKLKPEPKTEEDKAKAKKAEAEALVKKYEDQGFSYRDALNRASAERPDLYEEEE